MQSNPIYSLLDRFIRRHYINQLIKGVILFFAIGIGIFVVISLLVGLAYLSTNTRTLLFYALVGVELVIVYKFFVLPLLGLFRLRNTLSYKQASMIIGKHFPDVQDKLLNLLEFSEHSTDDALVLASIAQRTEKLTPIPFNEAIDFSENRRFLVYAVPTVLLLLFLSLSGYFFNVVEGTKRLAQHRTIIVPVAPFSFELVEHETAVVGKPYTISFMASGNVIPQDAFLNLNGQNIPLSKAGKNFEHTLSRVKNDLVCYVTSGDFRFGPFSIATVHPPQLSELAIAISYPKYTGFENTVKNQYDNLRIPEGTKLSFSLQTAAVDSAVFLTKDVQAFFARKNNLFLVERLFSNNDSYQVVLKSQNGLSETSDRYAIDIVKDAYPTVDASFILDSIAYSGIYVDATIEDDYGFSQVFWELSKDNHVVKKGKISLRSKSNYQRVQENISFEGIEKALLKDAVFRLGVADNDGINGPKTSYSKIVTLQPKEVNELRSESMRNSSASNEQLDEERQKLQESMQQLKDKNQELLRKKEPNWEDKKQLKELLKDQEKIREKLEELKEERKRQSEMDKDQSLFKEEILDKQKKIDDLLDKLLTDEMKELMREIEDLMDQLNKEELREKLEQLQLENSQLSDELDRYLELLEQLNFEKALDDAISELSELEDKQNQLKDADDADAAAQEELKEQLDNLDKKLDELEKKDQSLKKPNGFEKPEKDVDDAQKSMDKASEEMQNGNSDKAKKQQEKASESMKKAKESLMSFQGGMTQQQNAENMEDLRRILENLITLSTDQEKLMLRFGTISSNSVEYVSLIREQKILQSNSQIIADSLFALSKRVVEIEPFINKEMKIIDRNFDKSLEAFAERQLSKGTGHQQYVMTSTNNLSLLLNDALDQMQQQQAAMMEGNQNCQKPGSGKPSMDSLKKMQQELAEQLGKMKGQGEGDAEGEKGRKKGDRGMSKEVVEMMAKQEKIREELRSIAQEQQGKAMQELLEQLEENETDIANMKFDDAFFERQKEIMSRLLEAENAELKQKQDDQRQGETAKSQHTAFKEEIDAYLKQREKQIEGIRYDVPNFGYFYRTKQNTLQKP
ncbi:MAG: hypothetical protein LAT76_05705 [Schleiferiaceae bacterium]|nr:hypothetical protein [Schleiferiaceae bacterium]